MRQKCHRTALSRDVDEIGRPAEQQEALVTGDFNDVVQHDGRPDMTALITSSWSTGVTAWVVFRAKTMWSLALARVHVHSAAVRYRRGDLVETQPVKSGGYDHRRFHWQRRHFVVLRKWHTKQP